MRPGKMDRRVALDAEVKTPDGYGGHDAEWQEQFTAWAEFRYERGKEAVEASALTGTATFKVCLRSSQASRAITAEYRLRDVRSGVSYNVREVDGVTDRAAVWLVVESGVAL